MNIAHMLIMATILIVFVLLFLIIHNSSIHGEYDTINNKTLSNTQNTPYVTYVDVTPLKRKEVVGGHCTKQIQSDSASFSDMYLSFSPTDPSRTNGNSPFLRDQERANIHFIYSVGVGEKRKWYITYNMVTISTLADDPTGTLTLPKNPKDVSIFIYDPDSDAVRDAITNGKLQPLT